MQTWQLAITLALGDPFSLKLNGSTSWQRSTRGCSWLRLATALDRRSANDVPALLAAVQAVLELADELEQAGLEGPSDAIRNAGAKGSHRSSPSGV